MPERSSDPRTSLARYLDLGRTHPHLFDNPSSNGFRILLDEDSIRAVEAEVTQRLAQQGRPSGWAEVGIVYEDQYIVVLRDAVRFPDGHLDTYIRILPTDERPSGVAVLAMLDGRIVLLRHFRHATRAWHLEILRGFGSPGSSPEEDARREIAEEIGASPGEMTALGVMHPDSGLSADAVHLFHARLESIGRPEEHEAISDILEVDVSELEGMIADGRVTDSFTIAAYARARLLGLLDG